MIIIACQYHLLLGTRALHVPRREKIVAEYLGNLFMVSSTIARGELERTLLSLGEPRRRCGCISHVPNSTRIKVHGVGVLEGPY